MEKFSDFWEPFDHAKREATVDVVALSENRGALSAHAESAAMTTNRQAADFATVYRLHRGSLIRGLSIAIGDADLAADAVDEAFTRALHRWPTLSHYAAPEAWVYRAAKNWATSRFRRLGRDKSYARKIARPESVEDPEFDPGLADAIRTLSKDHHDVVVLRYFLDWPVSAVAEALKISPGTVKSRTSRALNELQVALAGDLGSPSNNETPRGAAHGE